MRSAIAADEVRHEADEVRHLADQTTKDAEDLAESIEALRAEVASTIEAMETSGPVEGSLNPLDEHRVERGSRP